MNDNAFTRRAFLQKGLTIVSTTATVPAFLHRSAFGMNNPWDVMLTSSLPGVVQDRILVVVQLGGGNDGLNTVVPYGDDTYYRRRPSIAIQNNDVHKITEYDGLGLHPNLTGVKELHDEGLVCTVQGVGYPNPNRSHFTSMDIWHSGDPRNPNGNGWIGRYFDATCAGAPKPNASISIGREAPKALHGDLNKPVSFESTDLFRWIGDGLHESMDGSYQKINRDADAAKEGGEGSQLDFLTRTSLDAQVASDQIREAVAKPPLVQYPGNGLAQQLRMVGAMIRAGLPTQVYYVNLGGFDTHAGQVGSHGNLMTQLSTSLLAFQRDLQKQGNDQRVLTMTFSEFGRRVGENGSRGTDHGTAAPMFLIGPGVKPGVANRHPSLTDLDQGDLKFQVDFRSVYASILQDWFKTDSKRILKGAFKPAPIIKA